MMAYLTLISITVAFLASLALYIQDNEEAYLRLFPLFLLLDVAQEAISVKLMLMGKSNIFIQNPWTVLLYCFYFYILFRAIHNAKTKRVIQWILLIYPVLCLVNILFIQKPSSFHTITYSLGGLLMVVLCSYFFFELFQHTRRVNLLREPMFWLCTGLLFYYACTFPLYGLTNFLTTPGSETTIRNLIIVFHILEVLLYLSFTIAFLCRLRVRKSTS